LKINSLFKLTPIYQLL